MVKREPFTAFFGSIHDVTGEDKHTGYGIMLSAPVVAFHNEKAVPMFKTLGVKVEKGSEITPSKVREVLEKNLREEGKVTVGLWPRVEENEMIPSYTFVFLLGREPDYRKAAEIVDKATKLIKRYLLIR